MIGLNIIDIFVPTLVEDAVKISNIFGFSTFTVKVLFADRRRRLFLVLTNYSSWLVQVS